MSIPSSVVGSLFLATALSAFAQPTCNRGGCGRIDCGTPARPAPAALWRGLQAVDSDPLPSLMPASRDATAFDEFHQQYSSVNWFESLDIENGWLFAGIAHGLQVWDVRGSGVPVYVGQIRNAQWPVWANDPHTFWPLHDVDAPAGADSLVAVVGQSGTGLAIIDAANKAAPQLRWQFAGLDATSVYAATLGGRHYAFVGTYAATAFGKGGLRIFDMDAPAPAGRVCNSPADCPGLYVGEAGSLSNAHYVDGVDNFIVVSQGTVHGVEIWDVSLPRQPKRVLRAMDASNVFGVALWREWGSTYYLGLITDHFVPGIGVAYDLQIYGVDCIAAGACAGLEAPLSVTKVSGGSSEQLLTFSRAADGKPFLYASKNDACNGGDPQREFLFDISDPTAPREIGGAAYWAWWYRGSPTGFNKVAPFTGKFSGNTFYRAAHTIMDAHQLASGGPVAPPGPPPMVPPAPPPALPPESSKPPAAPALQVTLTPTGCFFGFCTAAAGMPLGFTAVATAEPDFWDYDWNGDTIFEDAGHREQVASHVYQAAGTFFPVVRARRGAESAVGSARVIITGPAPPPAPVAEPPPVLAPACPEPTVCPEEACPACPDLTEFPADVRAVIAKPNKQWTRPERDRLQLWLLGARSCRKEE